MENTPAPTSKTIETGRKMFLNHRRNLQYQENPMLWYTERWRGPADDLDWTQANPEAYAKHTWDGTKNPFLDMFNSLARWQSVGIESATSTGKTYMLPRVIYWFLDAFPDSLVVTTAPKQSQLKNILWAEMSACFRKFKRIRRSAEMFTLRVMPQGTNIRFGSNFNRSFAMDDLEEDDYGGDLHQAIGVVSGVRADEESATKMQGFHRKYMLFVIEEAAGVPQPVLTAVKNTCTGDFNVILAVGNPDSQTDSLHLFSNLQHVNHIRISAFDHPNIVTGVSLIPGAVTQKSIDIRKMEYGERSNLYKSRVRGIAPKQSADSLIQFDWVVQCMVDRPEYVGVVNDVWSHNALGVDVANSEGGDMACLAWGKGVELWWLHEFQCPNANHLAHNVVKESAVLSAQKKKDYGTGTIKDFKISGHRIGVDAVGVGAGTVNEFNDLGYSIQALQGGQEDRAIPKDDQGKPLYKFKSLRAQMYFQARLDLQNHQVRINLGNRSVEDQLIKELVMIKYRVTDGYMVIDPKEEVKKSLAGKSPNLGDSFVYWNWVRKDRDGNFIDLPMASGSSAMPITEPEKWSRPDVPTTSPRTGSDELPIG